MNKTITIIGSSNTDMVVKAARLPAPGETILGGTFGTFPGGKGANQAVAAARLGGSIIFVGKRGADSFGTETEAQLRNEGIDTTHFTPHPYLPSGVALITINDGGENCIVVASGANAALTTDDVDAAANNIAQSSIVLLQLETPLATIQHAVSIAKLASVTVILNPAPAQYLPPSLLQGLTLITPNETEAEILTGIPITNIASAKKAAISLQEKGVQSIIITLGADGALLYHEGVFTKIDGVPVKAVDTTAAGDVFNGALAVGLAEGQSLEEAARIACRAAAISVTRMGAQSSAPTKNELYVHH